MSTVRYESWQETWLDVAVKSQPSIQQANDTDARMVRERYQDVVGTGDWCAAPIARHFRCPERQCLAQLLVGLRESRHWMSVEP